MLSRQRNFEGTFEGLRTLGKAFPRLSGIRRAHVERLGRGLSDEEVARWRAEA